MISSITGTVDFLAIQLTYQSLPALNALLNTAAASFLVLGYYYIKKRRFVAHYRAMWAALGMSALFLVSYVTYHTLRQMDVGVGHTAFLLEGPIRIVYYTVLFSHLVLAFTVVPLALLTLYRGWQGYKSGDIEKMRRHARIARWALPVWLYVSVTGVIVYLMLYQIPGAS